MFEPEEGDGHRTDIDDDAGTFTDSSSSDEGDDGGYDGGDDGGSDDD